MLITPMQGSATSAFRLPRRTSSSGWKLRDGPPLLPSSPAVSCRPYPVDPVEPRRLSHLSSHLCQRRLCLRQPEGHVHITVQRDGGGQFGASLLMPGHLGIQGAKTEVG